LVLDIDDTIATPGAQLTAEPLLIADEDASDVLTRLPVTSPTCCRPRPSSTVRAIPWPGSRPT
jgi:hypothetical protein